MAYELDRLACHGYQTLGYLKTVLDVDCMAMNIQQDASVTFDTTNYELSLATRFNRQWLTEQHLYGSSRLGIDKETRLLADSLRVRRAVFNPLVGWWKDVALLAHYPNIVRQDTGWHQADTLGAVHFEIANHLGNVLAVVSDRKIAVDSLRPLSVQHFVADRILLRDYYAFGMAMPGRSWAVDSSYRFGFNGKEKMLGLNGLDFGARVNDVRLGRWLCVDPMAAKYPDLSPYAYVANNPIIFIDPNGEDIKI